MVSPPGFSLNSLPLTLPGVIGVVLPIAAFAGAVYVTNRLSTESELTVMQATGYSPYRLIRPVAGLRNHRCGADVDCLPTS